MFDLHWKEFALIICISCEIFVFQFKSSPSSVTPSVRCYYLLGLVLETAFHQLIYFQFYSILGIAKILKQTSSQTVYNGL